MTAATGPAVVSPYKGLAPYDDSELDVLLFFGRERERELIVANLMGARLTVLYGESGVGKSSVLRAGVAHSLRELARRNRGERGEPELAIVVFDDWRDDPVAALGDAVGAAVREALGVAELEEPPVGASLADRVAGWAALLDGDLYVVLDQLEQYFIYHGGDGTQGSLVAELPEAVRRADARASFLLAIREDSLAKLDVFKAGIPGLFGNFLRLEHLDRRAARAAILEPVAQVNRLSGEDPVEVEPELVEAVLDEVEAGRVELGQGGRGAVEGRDGEGRDGEGRDGEARIETPYLQLVMQRLWDEERGAGSRTLRLATLRRLGGAQSIVRDHLVRALDDLDADERDMAAGVLDHLVTPSGTKIAHEARDLAGYAHVAEAGLLPVLEKLGRQRILRASAGRDGAGSTRYEIFHDVLAEPVLAWKARHEAGRELERARAEAARRHRRVVRVALAAIALLVLMAGVAIFALTQRTEAQAQAELSRARELAASATAQIDVDPELSLLLALEAARTRRTRQVEDVLRAALLESHVRAVLHHAAPVTTASFSRRGGLVLSASEDGVVKIWAPGGRRVLRVLRTGGRVASAQFSPGGRLVATAGPTGAALWRTATGARAATLTRGAAADVAFDRRGRLLATAGADGTARLYRVRAGALLRVLRHPGPVLHVVFSPNGRLLATVGGDPDGTNLRARIFDVATGRLLRVLATRGVTVASFSPDSRLLVTGAKNHLASIWDVGSGKRLHALVGHTSGVSDALFGPGGRLVVTTSGDGTIRLWRVRTGGEITVMSHANGVSDAAFDAEGKWLVTASSDDTARIWEVSIGRLETVLRSHTDAVRTAAFSPDGRLVATASADGTARLWEPGTDPELRVRGHARAPVTAASFSPDGRLIVSASLDGSARVWRVGSVAPGPRLRGGPFFDIRASADGSRVVTASADGTARIWRTGDGRLVRTLRHGAPVAAASFASEGGAVVTAGGTVARIWRRDGTPVATLRHPDAVCCAAFSPDGRLVVTGSRDGRARIWDAARGRLLHVLAGHRAPIVRAAFSPDGIVVATASADRTARLWDAATGALLHVLRGHRDGLTDVEFDPSGRTVVTASRDHDARTWEVGTGRLLRLLRAHFGIVFGASFSPDGRWIVTAGPVAAGLWRADTGRLVVFLEGPRGAITTASFSPDGTRILAGSRDGTTRVYLCAVCGDVDRLAAVAEARLARLGRTLSPAERARYLHS